MMRTSSQELALSAADITDAHAMDPVTTYAGADGLTVVERQSVEIRHLEPQLRIEQADNISQQEAYTQFLGILKNKEKELKMISDQMRGLEIEFITLKNDPVGQRFADSHENQKCGEYANVIRDQLQDAIIEKKAAILEKEGLMHLARENEMLKTQKYEHTELLLRAIREAKMNTKDLPKDIQESSQKAEKIEQENESPDLNDLIVSLSTHLQALSFSSIQAMSAEPSPPRAEPLGFSHIQEGSTTPFESEHQVITPLLRKRLNSLGAAITTLPSDSTSISSASTTTGCGASDSASIKTIRSNASIASTRTSSSSSLDDPTVRITIDPHDRRSFSLLSHINAALPGRAKLSIHGPPELTSSLLTSMHATQERHKTFSKDLKSTNAALTALQSKHDAMVDKAEKLKGELEKEKAKVCREPMHKHLKEQLEGKELQFVMQEGVIAEWKRKFEGAEKK